ncbi:hypothetical protein F0U60_06185 [Archangium minus]|uniref:Cyclophilin-like domain-containing protein n=1 Tax=Archangium minus TaxID=83450 RepID=A0ABY9WJH9_9BACT|nr:hypothetical protein F0U60_06185 [Archangium minus]
MIEVCKGGRTGVVYIAALVSALALAAAPVHAQQPARTEAKAMKIRLTMGEKVLTATLRDNETARDFVSLLPLTLTLEDYAATEKISDLPRRLSTKGAPEGTAAAAGDITYYAPWGNLALFHRDFRHSSGLVTLGKLDSGVEALREPGPLKVRIELAE